MIIIDKGTTKIEGSVEDLLNDHKLTVTFDVNESERFKTFLNETQWKSSFKEIEKNGFIFQLTKDEIPILNKELVEKGFNVNF